MAPAKKAAKKATKKSTAKRATKKSTAKRATKKSTGKRAGKKATKRAASRRSAAGSGASVVVASKLRETIRGRNVRMSADLVDALNAEVHELIAKAVQRAKDNGRSTVRPSDL